MILGDRENHRMAPHPWDAASCTAILPCVAEPREPQEHWSAILGAGTKVNIP